MDDLLQKQIRDSCKLALPDGLNDLMSDISREVLRSQPQNLLQFITDYLSALLVARENLFIASRVCDDVCKTHCYPELEDELREVGLSDEDVEKTVKVVTEFFESGRVKETNLLIKLLKKTEIDETQFPAVLGAVRGAFRRHQVNNTVLYESSSTDSDMDETLIAAKHTLKIYRKTKEPGDNYDNVVQKIQTAYRAYNVRRKFQHHRERGTSPSNKKTKLEKALHSDSKKVEQLFPETPRKRCSSKASSISLAGSFIPLPPYKPYSIDNIFEDDEVLGKEREHTSYDYTQHWKNSPEWQAPDDKKKDMTLKKKNISFHDLPQILNLNSDEVTDEIPEEMVEADNGFEEVDEEVIQEQVIKDHGMWPCHTEPKEESNETKNKDNDIMNEELINQQVIIKEPATQPMEEYAESENRDRDDIIDEEFTNEQVMITGHEFDEQTILSDDTTEMNEGNAKNKDGDGTITEELDSVIDEQVDINEMMWFNEASETLREVSEGDSRDGEDIVECFSNESAAASFTDLS